MNTKTFLFTTKVIYVSPLLLLMTIASFTSCESTDTGSSATSRTQTAASGAQISAEAQRNIDQQVASIAAGPHGELPPAQAIRIDPSAQTAEMHIKNDTRYTLTVLYSGPSSNSLVLPPHGTGTLVLNVGSYMVAARVNSSDVQPFAGSQDLQGGEYGSLFYIAIVPE